MAARDYRGDVCYGGGDWPGAAASAPRRPIVAAVSARAAVPERCCRRGERLTSINACECSRSAEVPSCRPLARSVVCAFVETFVRVSSANRRRSLNRRVTRLPFSSPWPLARSPFAFWYCSLSDQPAPTPPPPCAPPPLWETCV